MPGPRLARDYGSCALRNSFAAALAGTGSALESLPREDPGGGMRFDIETMKETPDLIYSGNTGQKTAQAE